MHKSLLADRNKEVTVQGMLAGEISWTVTAVLILSLQYLHQLCLEGHLVWGLSFVFVSQGKVITGRGVP